MIDSFKNWILNWLKFLAYSSLLLVGLLPFQSFAFDFSNASHYWSFESEHTDSIGSANFTGHGSTAFESGINGEAIGSFDASSYINTSLSASSPFSLSFWAKIPSNAGGTRIFSWWDGLGYLYVGSTPIIVFEGASGGGNIVTSTNWPFDGDFHHVVFTYYAGAGNLYLDGSNIGTNGTMSLGSGSTWSLGASGFGCAGCVIDEVSLFNVELSSSDVVALYNGGTGEFFATTTSTSTDPFIQATSTEALLSTTNFGLNIIIVLLFIIVIGFIFNNLDLKNKTKPWSH